MSKTTRLPPSPLTGVGEDGFTLAGMKPARRIRREEWVVLIPSVWLGSLLALVVGEGLSSSAHPGDQALGRWIVWLAPAFMLIAWLIWTGIVARGWASIQDGHARLSARAAWALLSVPGVHLVGVTIAGYGLARAMNDFAERHRIAGLRVNRVLHGPLAYIWWTWAISLTATLHLRSFFVPSFVALAPTAILGLSSLAIAALTVLSANDLCAAINRIADAQREIQT